MYYRVELMNTVQYIILFDLTFIYLNATLLPLSSYTKDV